MFQMPETPYINPHQPLAGARLSDLFAELANARGEMAADSNEVPFHDFVVERLKQLIGQRGGQVRAKLRMREVGDIAVAYAGIPNLEYTSLEALQDDPDKGLTPAREDFFTNMTLARGMMRLDGLMRGLMVVDQGKRDVYHDGLVKDLNRFVAGPHSEEQGAYAFVSAVDAFRKRAFKTALNPLKVMQIDYQRAIYFLSVRLNNAKMGVPAARALYWQGLSEAAETQGVRFDTVRQYQPSYFQEVYFNKQLRAKNAAPV